MSVEAILNTDADIGVGSFHYAVDMESPIAHEDLFVIESWQQAEFFACGHMQMLGFDDAATTMSGPDGGLDVEARGAVAQVKHFANSPVGAPAVQQLIGAASTKPHGLFYALTGYTPAAVRLAEKREVALFQYTLTGNITPISTAAERLVELGFVDWDPEVKTRDRDEFVGALQVYGQRVADACFGVMDQTVDAVRSLYEKLIEAGEHQNAVELMNQVSKEANQINALLAPLGGRSDRLLAKTLEDIARIESLGVQLSVRLGLNYQEISARAREERASR